MTSSLPQRKSLRLRYHDYASAGMYFVTICTHARVCLFGSTVENTVRLSALGRVVEKCWLALPAHHPQVGLDEFVVMPNHIHGIVVLGVGQEPGAMNRAPTILGEVVRAFKARCTRLRANGILDNVSSSALWQRNYHEHVIRNAEDLGRVREYIHSNPAQWAMDSDNPDFRSTITVEDIAPLQL